MFKGTELGTQWGGQSLNSRPAPDVLSTRRWGGPGACLHVVPDARGPRRCLWTWTSLYVNLFIRGEVATVLFDLFYTYSLAGNDTYSFTFWRKAVLHVETCQAILLRAYAYYRCVRHRMGCSVSEWPWPLPWGGSVRVGWQSALMLLRKLCSLASRLKMEAEYFSPSSSTKHQISVQGLLIEFLGQNRRKKKYGSRNLRLRNDLGFTA